MVLNFMNIDLEDDFYCELGKAIQMWLWVEEEMYRLYAEIMDAAKQHSVSVTFNHIQSFESKVTLIDSCLKLLLDTDSQEFKDWKKHQKKARKLNDNRNKIVHESVIQGRTEGREEIYIAPSFSDSLALVKNKTTYKRPVISGDYEPRLAKLEDAHKIYAHDLYKFKMAFKGFSQELRVFRERIAALIKESHQKAREKKRG